MNLNACISQHVEKILWAYSSTYKWEAICQSVLDAEKKSRKLLRNGATHAITWRCSNALDARNHSKHIIVKENSATLSRRRNDAMCARPCDSKLLFLHIHPLFVCIVGCACRWGLRLRLRLFLSKKLQVRGGCHAGSLSKHARLFRNYCWSCGCCLLDFRKKSFPTYLCH